MFIKCTLKNMKKDRKRFAALFSLSICIINGEKPLLALVFFGGASVEHIAN